MDSRRVVRVPAAVWCLPAVAYAALIFALSSTTLPPEAGPIPGLFRLDKLLHIAEYAVLGALTAVAVRRVAPAFRWGGLVAFVAGLGYAASDEFHQTLVPGRRGDVWDFLADALGVALGVLVVLWLARRSAPRIEEPDPDGRTP